AIGLEQTSNHIDDRGLARARGPEQGGHAAGRLEAHRKLERAELFLHVDGEHDQFPWTRMPARRANHSETTSAASARMIANRTSRLAAASPPGICIKV